LYAKNGKHSVAFNTNSHEDELSILHVLSLKAMNLDLGPEENKASDS